MDGTTIYGKHDEKILVIIIKSFFTIDKYVSLHNIVCKL